MWGVIVNRFKQGFRTLTYPKDTPSFPKRFRGRPNVPVDMGECLFNEGGAAYSQDYRMAVSKKEDLILKGDEIKLAAALDEKTRRIFGR